MNRWRIALALLLSMLLGACGGGKSPLPGEVPPAPPNASRPDKAWELPNQAQVWRVTDLENGVTCYIYSRTDQMECLITKPTGPR